MTVRFTAETVIQIYAARRGLTPEEMGVAPTVVITWAARVARALAELTGAVAMDGWIRSQNAPLYTAELEGQRVSFIHVGVGAPATIATMEELIACGARRFIGLGWAGSLQPTLPIGALLIPTRCVRDEGTSPHYVADISTVSPEPALLADLVNAAEAEGMPPQMGLQWSTDAPYRELVSEIDAHRARGVLGVDMETSAMYALGQVRAVAVCNLLVISDEVWHAWQTAARTPALAEATARAQRVVLAALGWKPKEAGG